MGYRDELEAALQRAAALEREMEALRSERVGDEGKVAELERALREAKARLAEKQPDPPPPTPKPPKPPKPARKPRGDGKAPTWPVIGIAALFLSVFGYFGGRGCADWLRIKDGIDVTRRIELARSRVLLPDDAELTAISASFVDESGVAQIRHGGDVRYSFVSPSRAALRPPPGEPVPIGVKPPEVPLPTCSAYVLMGWARRASVSTFQDHRRSDTRCDTAMGAPRCTAAQVWSRARAEGAPSGALASLDYSAASRSWSFRIATIRLERTIPDDCGPQ